MGALNAVKDKVISFWQSRSFYTFANDRGKLVERELGTDRPKALPFVKGGRRAALAEAERLWGKLEAPARSPSGRPAADGEDGDVRGERPDPGQPLEDEKPALVSDQSARISPARGSVTGQPFVRITRDTLGKHGLPR